MYVMIVIRYLLHSFAYVFSYLFRAFGAFARLEAALQSTVLLKNDGRLPLQRNLRLAVLGPLRNATEELLGNYQVQKNRPKMLQTCERRSFYSIFSTFQNYMICIYIYII